MVTRRIDEERKNLSSREIRCVICGSPDVMAKIDGKYYCAYCGSRVVKENVLRQIENWKKAGLIPEHELDS